MKQQLKLLTAIFTSVLIFLHILQLFALLLVGRAGHIGLVYFPLAYSIITCGGLWSFYRWPKNILKYILATLVAVAPIAVNYGLVRLMIISETFSIIILPGILFIVLSLALINTLMKHPIIIDHDTP